MASGIGSTTNIWPYYASSNVKAAAREPVKELGKDQFLQILVTQLRNQDPLQPMQDNQFIAQMAQFSSLEQMMNMSNEMSALRQSAGMVAALIGKTISWMDSTETGNIVNASGIVDSIVWRDGLQYAKVQNKEVLITDILSISDTAARPGESEVE